MRGLRFTLGRLLVGLSLWSVACLGAILFRTTSASGPASFTHAIVVIFVALPLVVFGLLGGVGCVLGRTWDAILLSLVLIGLVWLGGAGPYLLLKLWGSGG